MFLFGSGFRPILSIYVRPKLFYELGKKRKNKFETHISHSSLYDEPHPSYNMLGVSIGAVKKQSPIYHSLTLEK